MRSQGIEERRVRYWCQDESRFGLKTIERRLLTGFGVKPMGIGQWKRENYYLYGVVEPTTGCRLFSEFSHLDTTCFQAFLELFSQAYPKDFHIIQLDNGSFHKAIDQGGVRSQEMRSQNDERVAGGNIPPAISHKIAPEEETYWVTNRSQQLLTAASSGKACERQIFEGVALALRGGSESPTKPTLLTPDSWLLAPVQSICKIIPIP